MTWYAYGDFVLDRLLGVDQCSDVKVFAPRDAMLCPADVRRTLRMRDDATVAITDTEPRIVIHADRFVVDSTGAIRDRVTDEVRTDAKPSLELQEFELTAADIIRLFRVMNRYSELVVDRSLTSRITADISHMRSLMQRFPELEILLWESATG